MSRDFSSHICRFWFFQAQTLIYEYPGLPSYFIYRYYRINLRVRRARLSYRIIFERFEFQEKISRENVGLRGDEILPIKFLQITGGNSLSIFKLS